MSKRPETFGGGGAASIDYLTHDDSMTTISRRDWDAYGHLMTDDEGTSKPVIKKTTSSATGGNIKVLQSKLFGVPQEEQEEEEEGEEKEDEEKEDEEDEEEEEGRHGTAMLNDQEISLAFENLGTFTEDELIVLVENLEEHLEDSNESIGYIKSCRKFAKRNGKETKSFTKRLAQAQAIRIKTTRQLEELYLLLED